MTPSERPWIVLRDSDISVADVAPIVVITNHELVGRALTSVRDAVRPVVERIWRGRFGARWRDQVNRRLPHRDRHANPDDLAFLLKGMDATWDECFRGSFSRSTRSYLHLLWEARNRWAHNERFNPEETRRILDHSEMMLQALGADRSAAQVQELKRILQTQVLQRDAELKKAIPEAWLRMLAEPDEDLLDLVGQRVHEQTGLQPTRKEVESLLQPFLVPQQDPKPPMRQPSEPNRPVSPPRLDGPDFKRKPSGIRLWGDYQPVSSWTRVLLLVLEGLHDRHGSDAFERVLSRLVTRRRDTLSRPVQVGNTGFWINRSIPIPEIHRRSYASLKAFGHPGTDLEIVDD